jgi:hypothetical protein
MNQNSKQLDAFKESKRGLIYNVLGDDSLKALPLSNTDGDVKLNEGAAL